jgi:hypothetical protein
MARDPCASIGWGGDYQIDGDLRTAHLTWLPKGYGPSLDMFTICLVRIPPDERGSVKGMDSEHPLLVAVKEAVETYMHSRVSGGVEPVNGTCTASGKGYQRPPHWRRFCPNLVLSQVVSSGERET